MAGLAGRIFGGYELTGQLAGGGIAEVYRGRPTKPGGRDVVVKVFYPEFARQPGFKAHFRQIVQMSTQLANHPHILPLLAGDEDGGYLYLVTPFVSNGTLKDWLSGGGRMGAHDIAPFFRQLCDALTYAHNHGGIHGNVKPSNICLYEGRHVLLGDFGLFWDPTQVDMDHSGSGAEAVEFLAPEVIAGQQTQLSDVYSVGAVLYSVITGASPFRGARLADVIAAHRHQPVPRLEQVNPLLSPGLLALDAVIQRAMGKRPEDRFPSAAAMALAIETAIHQAPQSTPQQPQPVPSSFAPGMPAQAPVPQYPGTPVMAPGAAGSPVPPAGSIPLQPLNPPFPPLPQMAAQETPLATVPPQFAAPNVAPEPPAPTPPTPAPSALPLADSTAETTMRVPAPVPPPMPPTEPASFSWSGNFLGDDDEVASQQEMPAIRIPAIQRQAPGPNDSVPFDAWGGSTAGLDPLSADELGEHSSLPDGIRGSAPLYQPPRDDGYSDALDWAESGEQRGWPALGPNGYGDGDDELVDRDLIADWTAERNAYALADANDEADIVPPPTPPPPVSLHDPEGFSPTQLGLPRLTSPAVPSASQWRDIVSDSLQLPAFDPPHSVTRNDEPLRWSDAGETMWERPGYSDQGDSMEIPRARGNAVAASGLLDPEPPRDAQGAHISARGGLRGRHMQAEPVEQPDFDDERDWTRGVHSLRRPRRWPRKVALVLLLVLLLDLVVVVLARPDLCPNANCRVVSAALRQRVALVMHTGIAAGPLTVAPVALNISTTSNSTTTASITLTNGSATPANWNASASLSWIKVTPAQGTLAPGASTTLTATIGTNRVPPGPYTGTVDITSGHAKGSIPVTVAVGAAAALSATPTSLAFSKCDSTQTITLKNGGTSPLTYQAAPSQSSVLSLKGNSGNIPAGGSAKITVTLSCSASHGTDYTVNITSTNGSTVVPVHYP